MVRFLSVVDIACVPISGGLESIRDSHNSHPNECDSHLSSREHVARVANRVAKARREAALRKKVMEDTNVTRHNIMSFLDTKDYLAMMGTSKAIRQPLFAERFDINSRLSDFVKDPIALRQLWCDCNALVGGDMLMRMLDGNIRRGSSLEFFVEAGQRFKALDDYIISEGYKVDSRRILGKPSLNGGTEVRQPEYRFTCRGFQLFAHLYNRQFRTRPRLETAMSE